MKPKTKKYLVIGVFLLLMTLTSVNASFTCATNCLKCFGAAANQCTECDPSSGTPYLQAFTCVASCTIGTADSESNICLSSKYDTDNVCAKGTYNPSVGGNSVGSCQSCDGGQYCKGTGQDVTNGPCKEGYYCTSGAKYLANDDGIAGATGGRCDAGNFCPTGSSAQTTCTAGKYCSEDYLSTASFDCIERYYCSGGTNKERPTSDATNIKGFKIEPKVINNKLYKIITYFNKYFSKHWPIWDSFSESNFCFPSVIIKKEKITSRKSISKVA